MNFKRQLCVLFCFLTVLSMQAQDKPSVPKRVYQTQALGDLPSPEIDGLINEESWNTVEWTGDYIENQPDENTPPTEQTKFKIVYDKKFLYFRF
jgi:hypothetical protein